MTRAAQAARRADRLVGAFKRHRYEGNAGQVDRVVRRVQKLTGASRRNQES